MKYFAKRISGLLLAGIMAMSCLPLQAAAVGDSTETGAGTAKDPYLLTIPADLDLLRKYPDSCFQLTQDIDMKDVAFRPVEEKFTGTLDGKGFAIRNLSVTDEYAALFMVLDYAGTNAQGVVKNLAFVNPTIKGQKAAAVVAGRNNGYISNVSVQGGSVSATAADGYAGALAARNTATGVLQKSGVTVAVSAATAGGLTGIAEGGKIQNCYAGGKVQGMGKTATTGSVLGLLSGKTLTTANVYYNTNATTLLTAGQTADGTPYSTDGLISVTLNVPEGLVKGAKGESLATFSAQPKASASLIRYATGDSKVLSVDKNTGAYELLGDGSATYKVIFNLDTQTDYFTYDISVTLPKEGASSDATGGTDSASSSQATTSASSGSGTQADSTTQTSSSHEAVSSTSDTGNSASVSSSSSASNTSTVSSSSTAASSASQGTASSSSGADSDSASTSASQSASASAAASQSTSSSSNSEGPRTLQQTRPASNPDVIVTGAWETKNGKSYYIYNDGTKATGPKTIDGASYIFGEDGAAQVFSFFYDNAWYYANRAGVLYTNCLMDAYGESTYYGADGAARLGWQTRGSVSIYHIKSGDRYVLAKGVAEADGVLCLFAEDGQRVQGTGWTDGVYLENGIVQTGGPRTVEGKQYIFSPNGKPYAGEFTYLGKAYCADEKGALYLDSFRALPDGGLRYYNAEGAAVTGWIDRVDGRYYQTGELKLLTGRQGVDGTVYFFGSNGRLSTTDGWAGDYYLKGGVAYTGLQSIEGKLYIFNKDGLVQKGAFSDKGDNYYGDVNTGALYLKAIAAPDGGAGTYYGENGIAAPGWVDYNGGRYYQGKDLRLVTGKQTIDSQLYFFDATGRQKTDNGWAGEYYLQEGKALTGKQTLDGNLYIFSGNGAVYKGEFTYNGVPYCADGTGALYTNVVRKLKNGASRYFGADGAAKTGWVTDANGNRYYQNGDYIVLTGVQKIGDEQFYFMQDGRLIHESWAGDSYIRDGKRVTGSQTIDGKQYIFSNIGIPYKYEFTYEGNRFCATSTGVLYANAFLTRGGGTTYFGVDGAARKGWIERPGIGKYYQDDNYRLLTGKQTLPDGKTYFFGSNGLLSTADGWAGEYYVKNGEALTNGPHSINGKQYIFNADGLVKKGEFVYQTAQYGADETGALYLNSVVARADGSLRLYGADGKAVQGWQVLDGKRYYQSDALMLLTGRQTIENTLCFFGTDGVLKTDDGWTGDYYLKGGQAVTGPQTIETKPYIFSADGLVQKGSFVYDGATYYGDLQTGVLTQAEIRKLQDGTLRYFGADGKAVSGWITIGENKYYQKAENLVLATGKQSVQEADGSTKIYFFEADGRLKSGDGWAGDFYLKDGAVVTGPQTIDQVDYIFDADGRVQKGHFQLAGAWYHGDPATGAMTKSAVKELENGKLRAFGADGKASAGWVDVGTSRYYNGADYTLVTGKQTLDGKVYFFEPDGQLKTTSGWVDGYYVRDGVMLTGRQSIDNKDYIFGVDGLVLKGEFVFENVHYYANPAGTLQKDYTLMRSDGTLAYYDENGAAMLGWVETPGALKYYQTDKGGRYTLSTGLVDINGDTYYFDALGRLFAGRPNGWYVIGSKQYYILSDGRYCASPTITNVATAYDAAQGVYKLTVDHTLSKAAGTHAGGSFSFDGGINWQTSNIYTIKAAQGVSLVPGKIQVRDGVGQSTMYTKAISLAPVSPPISGNRGIDVSMYNGNINWTQVAQSGVSFALIRASSYNKDYGGYYMDPYFETNVRNAKAAGLNVGVYLFSYATSYEDIQTEVNFFLNSQQMQNIKASGIKFDYPVYIDYESSLNLNGTTYQSRTDIVRVGMQMLEKAGYYPGFYTYHSYINNFNVAGLVSEGYDFWYARYPLEPNPDVNPSGSLGTTVGIWQYCSDGNSNPAMKPYVNGITTSLDLNVTYKDYPSIVHQFNGGGSGTTPPPVTQNTLTVYDLNSGKVVTDDAGRILGAIVQNEVGGFNNAALYQAQAVAAHSWILYQLQTGNPAPNVGLASSVSSAVTSAVEPVKNKIVTYNGLVANTMYSSANSGVTQSSAAMWGQAYPYLTAGIASPGDLSATVNTWGGTSWNGRSNTIKLATMTNNIEKMFPGSTNGRTDYQNWLTEPTYDGNGYLASIKVMGNTVNAGRFYDNCWGLYSPNFTMQYNGNSTWTFVTKGNGHCVGMSQWGAYGFAKQGSSWDQIIAYYYPGTAITTTP